LVRFVHSMVRDVTLAVNVGLDAGVFHNDMKEPNIVLILVADDSDASHVAWPLNPAIKLSLSETVITNSRWMLIDWDSGIASGKFECILPGPVSAREDPPPYGEESDLDNGFHFGCELAKAAILLLFHLGSQASPLLRTCMLDGRNMRWYEHFTRSFGDDEQPCRQRRFLGRLQKEIGIISDCLLKHVAENAEVGEPHTQANSPPRNVGSEGVPVETVSLVSTLNELVGRPLLEPDVIAGRPCMTWPERKRFLRT